MAANPTHEFHNFPKLAEESGFAFNPLRSRVHIDWNRIRSIDIESLIRDRKFYLIEQHISDILNCALESEFDVRILDEGVIKMFRLAQLSVEYQQFCRHYLDRSIHVLRDEITSLVQELDTCKRELRERDEDLKRLKRKTKNTYRPPLPYSNDNIATMILKTLANKGDVFPSTSNTDAGAYNRCRLCDKAFLNQLYLKSHVARRHPETLEKNIPEKENPEPLVENIETSEKKDSNLNEEIMQLKSKLQQMENMISKAKESEDKVNKTQNDDEPHDGNQKNKDEAKKNTKDAEVSTNNEDYLLDKIEEWKREEHEKYNKEINLLRTQILDTINSLKEREPKELPKQSDCLEHLHITIKQQGAEIHALKQELSNSKLLRGDTEIESRKETEAQMILLAQRTETQSKQYEALLQKLNEVAREAQESRALAEAERERASQLQVMLQNHLSNQTSVNNSPSISKKATGDGKKKSSPAQKSNPLAGRNSLESLHRKAQELLNIGSSSSSDMSSAKAKEEVIITSLKKNKALLKPKASNANQQSKESKVSNRTKTPKLVTSRKDRINATETLQPKSNKNTEKVHIDAFVEERLQNDPHRKPGSPVKLVRSKITEEVNSRLVSIGVDPLKNRLPQSIFKKHRTKLQQENDNKSKKNPAYMKVRHKILTYLDTSTSTMNRSASETNEYVSPSKVLRAKPFSISSVLSNVKSKALNFVKTNDANILAKRNGFASKAEIARKTMITQSAVESDSESSSKEVERKSVADVKQNPLNIRRRHVSESTTADITKQPPKMNQMTKVIGDENDESSDSYHKYHDSVINDQTTKSIENLIKSPARRPASANAIYNDTVRKFTIDKMDRKPIKNGLKYSVDSLPNHDNTSDDIPSSIELPLTKAVSVDNVQTIPKTKGVLKNASSMSSLNKKKVLFDMDAIQMKSVSASPSQSINEKNDGNEKFELGLVNLEGEDWDISSIENEPLNNDTKIKVHARASPKIAELRQSIEFQLAQRREGTTNLVGGVDILKGPPVKGGKAPSTTGSNTSLGSSILDESDVPVVNNNAFLKPKSSVTGKNDSDLDLSENSIDAIFNNNKSKKDIDSF